VSYSIRFVNDDGLLHRLALSDEELVDLARRRDPTVGDVGDALDTLVAAGYMVVSGQG
jgi:hypothetical protein